jgi:hypothetical protein
MFKRMRLLAAVVGGLVTLTAPAPAGATTFDDLAFMTFSGRVQVPGAMLDAGTYRFRLTNPSTDRNVIQVLSHDGSIVYAMFHTMPDARLNATDEPAVTWKETPVGVPPAIRSLFYGGEHSGYEFVYPAGWNARAEEPMLPQPPITFAPIAAAPVVAAEAAPVEAAPAFAEPMAEPAAEAAPAELPRTASLVPLVALTGTLAVVIGLGIGLLPRHES